MAVFERDFAGSADAPSDADLAGSPRAFRKRTRTRTFHSIAFFSEALGVSVEALGVAVARVSALMRDGVLKDMDLSQVSLFSCLR